MEHSYNLQLRQKKNNVSPEFQYSRHLSLGLQMTALTQDTCTSTPKDDYWLSMDGGLDARLHHLHLEIREAQGLTALDRISVAVYDSKLDKVRTFLESNIGPRPLERVADRLTRHTALMTVARTGEPWIDNDIPLPTQLGAGPGNQLARSGYQSRYVVRTYSHNTLYGFIFFNSRSQGYFTEGRIQQLLPYRRLIDVMVVGELTSQRGMLAAVRTALQVSQYRDEETGAHLDRMSHYAELIAHRIAARRGLTDEYVEYVRQYAPLHDIGKVAVPDSILLKPGRLTPDEFEIMKTHVNKGVQIIDAMINDHGLEALPHRQLLRNIVGTHHESYDGTGYPNGLKGDDIPLEGRIASVADVFDALSSKRSYKEAWSFERTADFMREQSGRKFDPECVEILLSEADAIKEIQQRFQDTPDESEEADRR